MSELVCYRPPVEDYRAVTRCYRQWGEKAKCGKRDRVYCLAAGEQLRAAARLTQPGPGLYLLRNLTVAPEYRRQGLARQLMQSILADPGARPLYCYALAYLTAFYRSLGFETLADSDVPEPIATPYRRYLTNGKDFTLMGFDPNGNRRGEGLSPWLEYSLL